MPRNQRILSKTGNLLNILVRRNRSSGDLETACPGTGTALDR